MQETMGKATRMFFILTFFLQDLKMTHFALIVWRRTWANCIRGPFRTFFLVVISCKTI